MGGSEFNFIDVFSPILLFKIKSLLCEIEPGKVIDVWVGDSDVVKDIYKIVNRAGDEIVDSKYEGGCCRITIKKGETRGEPADS